MAAAVGSVSDHSPCSKYGLPAYMLALITASGLITGGGGGVDPRPEVVAGLDIFSLLLAAGFDLQLDTPHPVSAPQLLGVGGWWLSVAVGVGGCGWCWLLWLLVVVVLVVVGCGWCVGGCWCCG